MCNGFEPLVDPKNPTMEEMRIIHLNGQATSVLLSALDGDEYNRVIVTPLVLRAHLAPRLDLREISQ